MDILSYILQGLLGLAFLGGGLAKLFGAKANVDNFNHLGLPQWFRVVTGLVEVVGAAAAIVGYWEPSWAAAAGLWLAVTMLGAVLAHVRIKEPIKQSVPALVLLVLSLVLFLVQLDAFSEFPGF